MIQTTPSFTLHHLYPALFFFLAVFTSWHVIFKKAGWWPLGIYSKWPFLSTAGVWCQWVHLQGNWMGLAVSWETPECFLLGRQVCPKRNPVGSSLERVNMWWRLSFHHEDFYWVPLYSRAAHPCSLLNLVFSDSSWFQQGKCPFICKEAQLLGRGRVEYSHATDALLVFSVPCLPSEALGTPSFWGFMKFW